VAVVLVIVFFARRNKDPVGCHNEIVRELGLWIIAAERCEEGVVCIYEGSGGYVWRERCNIVLEWEVLVRLLVLLVQKVRERGKFFSRRQWDELDMFVLLATQ